MAHSENLSSQSPPPAEHLHSILPCKDENKIAQQTRTFAGTMHRHSPSKVAQFTYRLGELIAQSHPSLNFKLFWSDPVGAARACTTLDARSRLFEAIVRLSKISRTFVEHSRSVPESRQANEEIRKEWFRHGAPAEGMDHDLSKFRRMLGEVDEQKNLGAGADNVLLGASLPHIPQSETVAKDCPHSPTEDLSVSAEPLHTESSLTPPSSAPPESPKEVALPIVRPAGERIFPLLPQPLFVTSRLGTYREHSLDAVKKFATTLANHLLTHFGVPHALFTRDPMDIVRRTDLNIDTKDRLLSLAIIRFAHLTENGIEFIPGTKDKAFASPPTRLGWIKNENKPPAAP